MDEPLFNDLIESLKQAKSIAQGHSQPSRQFNVLPPDVKAARETMGLTQTEFAKLMHVSIKTLQNWEQHRRNPTGPAVALLKMVLSAPEFVRQTLHS
jgi:putative transcriptional regulator